MTNHRALAATSLLLALSPVLPAWADDAPAPPPPLKKVDTVTTVNLVFAF